MLQVFCYLFFMCFTFIHILPSVNVSSFSSLPCFFLVILSTFITSHSSLVFFFCLLVCLLPYRFVFTCYFTFIMLFKYLAHTLFYSSHNSNTLPYYISFHCWTLPLLPLFWIPNYYFMLSIPPSHFTCEFLHLEYQHYFIFKGFLLGFFFVFVFFGNFHCHFFPFILYFFCYIYNFYFILFWFFSILFFLNFYLFFMTTWFLYWFLKIENCPMLVNYHGCYKTVVPSLDGSYHHMENSY
jgi:small-conductance mechanosensitive channel